MRRALIVIAAAVILILVGFYVGQRPVGPLRETVDKLKVETGARIAEAEKSAEIAEARGELWRARSEILTAAVHATRSNFGLATEQARRASERVTHAAAVPGVNLDVAGVHAPLNTAVERLALLDGSARDLLEAAAEELGRLLAQTRA